MPLIPKFNPFTRKIEYIQSTPAVATGGFVAGEALDGYRAVMLNSVGHAVYADSGDLSHAGRAIGVTAKAAALGGDVTIRLMGEIIEPAWAWDILKSVFLGPNGTLVQVPPISGFVQIIGRPITAQSLFINPKPHVTLV